VMAETGHSPFIEKHGEFMEHFGAHLSA